MNVQDYVQQRAGEQGEDDKWRTQMAKQLARMQRAQDEQQARLAAALKAQAAALTSIMDTLNLPTYKVKAIAAQPQDPVADRASGTQAPTNNNKMSGWLYKRSNVRSRTPPAPPFGLHAVRTALVLPPHLPYCAGRCSEA